MDSSFKDIRYTGSFTFQSGDPCSSFSLSLEEPAITKHRYCLNFSPSIKERSWEKRSLAHSCSRIFPVSSSRKTIRNKPWTLKKFSKSSSSILVKQFKGHSCVLF